MKKITSAIITGLGVMAASSAMAIPTLQLDIGGGTYDRTTQTIVSGGTSFTVYAYLDPNNCNRLDDTYYITTAVVPKVSSDLDLGSFTFNGDVVDVTGDMTYGVPPLEQSLLAMQDPGDLPQHGIYETYFSEFAFSFAGAPQIAEYNTADRAKNGGAITFGGTGMYFVAFTVDTSGLSEDYNIHFDLFNSAIKRGGDIDVTQFAPFSHDAESKRVPEPGVLLLLGTGLLGVGLLRRIRPHA